MAATTSNATPRKNGFDFAALSASAGKQDSGDEVARLRAALETLSELVIAHGVMDARTLESIVGDLIRPTTTMAPMALAAPLPPPAPSAAEAILRGGVPKPAAIKPAVAPRPVAAMPAPIAQRPVAATPAPVPAPAPAPIVQRPVAAAPAPAPVAAPIVAQPPVAAPVVAAAAPVPTPVAVEKTQETVVVPPSTVQPVVASPFPSEPALQPLQVQVQPQPVARKNPFDVQDVARVEAELAGSLPPPTLKPQSFFSKLFGRPKASPAAVAKAAASVEFTERVQKLPVDGLYSEQQRATELSFPPTASVQRKPRPAAAPVKKQERPIHTAPARFCDRCWRRMDASGTCKTCSPSASA
jgi:hypothetical protein